MTDNEIHNAQINRAYYESVGQQLQKDALTVEFTLNGEKHIYKIDNTGWGFQNPTLQLMAKLGIKPSDFEEGEITFENEEIPVMWSDQSGYIIYPKYLIAGSKDLDEAKWFNPNGNVYNGSGNLMTGMTINHDGGSNEGVEIEEQ